MRYYPRCIMIRVLRLDVNVNAHVKTRSCRERHLRPCYSWNSTGYFNFQLRRANEPLNVVLFLVVTQSKMRNGFVMFDFIFFCLFCIFKLNKYVCHATCGYKTKYKSTMSHFFIQPILLQSSERQFEGVIIWSINLV